MPLYVEESIVRKFKDIIKVLYISTTNNACGISDVKT
jgi:hypothetical protein